MAEWDNESYVVFYEVRIRIFGGLARKRHRHYTGAGKYWNDKSIRVGCKNEIH